eukprot:jgi/Ulvmu1/7666/UM038_0095.1
MTFTVYIKDKDAFALKLCACIAAGEDNADISVVPHGTDVSKKVALPLPSRGLPALVAEDGSVIQDCHAAAKLLGGPALSPAALQGAIDDLLDLHETTVLPAIRKSVPDGSSIDPKALKPIEDALKHGHYLLPGSDKPTLADFCIAIDLLSLSDIGALPGPVAAFTERVKNLPQCSSALQTLQLSDWDEVAAVSKAAVSAVAAAAPRLPKPGARNVLITSALPYVNNVPHLGNIIGCVLSADVHSRYCRARGYNSIFVCGTDEYGTATETKALEEGLTCQEICDKYHAIHKQIYEWFQIDFDKFGRTPTRAQTEITQGIFRCIHGNGHLVERTNQQLYSTALDKFLADRYVVGTCPKCGYEDARGDQCDNCGALLNPTELRNPRCKFSGTEPVLRETSHLHINLPQLEEKLRAYIDGASKEGGWSANCVAMTEAWLKGGLKERGITRDLKWGTPVPLDGFRSKVFYVWFDAPIGYLSITANYTPEWERWWRAPDDVELVQFMGKDNVTFHTIIFPCTLLGTGEKWTMMRKISVTEYLNYEGGKFSKSRGTGVFGDGAIASGIPCDIFRYYLLATRPETNDSDFRWADLAQRNNSELLKNLGNFINRVVSFTCNKLNAKAPQPAAEAPPLVAALNTEVTELAAQYVELMEAIKIRDGVAKVLQVSAAGNKFLQDTQFWTLPKAEAATMIAAALGLVKVLAAMLQPYMPGTAATVLRMLCGPREWLSLGEPFDADVQRLQAAVPPGHALGKPELLFSVIPDEVVQDLQGRFAGTQADAAASAVSSATAAAPSGKAPAAGAKPAGGAAPGKGGKGKGAGKDGAAATGKGKSAESKDKPVDVSRIDLRVGLITKVAKHPDADSLYVEDIQCGEEAARVVVSGLVKHIHEPEMQNRLVVVVANLKPANLKGIKSHAMVLAATGADGTVELVDPPAGSKPGDRVYVEGYEAEPDVQLNPKHKVFEAVHPDFSTNDALQACYKGKPLLSAQGPCTVKTVTGATIK